jgi:pimeloyl-ACP methyl ester carboxylesterase
MSHSDKLLITVHGVNSDNRGLGRLADHCKRALRGLRTFALNYGEHFPSKVLSDATCGVIFKAAQGELLNLTLHLKQQGGLNSQTKIFMAAHSFGTMVTRQCLERAPRGFSVERIILLGSILDQWTDWDWFIQSSKVLRNPPLNIVRPFDAVVRQGRRIRKIRGGLSGIRGFSPMGSYVPVDYFKRGGHVDYDPDDFEDIAHVIDGSFDYTRVCSEDEFMKSLSKWEKFTLSGSRLFRIR